MKVIISSGWSFIEAYERAWDAYRGSGITSRGHRNSVMMAWGNVVGKDRALSELNRLIRDHGSKKALAAALGISASALRKIELHFESLPDAFEAGPPPLNLRFKKGTTIAVEEDIAHEFKRLPAGSRDPVTAIIGKTEAYAVAFLNSAGGRLLWGITDEGLVEGVVLTRAEKDDLRKRIASKLRSIQPPVDPSVVQLNFHHVVRAGERLADHYIIELGIPNASNGRLYFTSDNSDYVRLEGVNQKLVGPAIQEWIERRRPSES